MPGTPCPDWSMGCPLISRQGCFISIPCWINRPTLLVLQRAYSTQRAGPLVKQTEQFCSQLSAELCWQRWIPQHWGLITVSNVTLDTSCPHCTQAPVSCQSLILRWPPGSNFRCNDILVTLLILINKPLNTKIHFYYSIWSQFGGNWYKAFCSELMSRCVL